MLPALCSLQEGREHIAHNNYTPWSKRRPGEQTSQKLVHSSSFLTAGPRRKNWYCMMTYRKNRHPTTNEFLKIRRATSFSILSFSFLHRMKKEEDIITHKTR